MHWTEKDFDVLKQWYGKIPIKELAEQLRRSESAVYKQAHILNLATIPPRTRFLRHYCNSKLSDEEIAHRLGVDCERVATWKRETR